MNTRKCILAACVMLLPNIAQAAYPSAFAFGANGSWIIVYENKGQWGYRGEHVPDGLASRIKEMAENEVILGVAMNSNAWVLVGSKTWHGNGLPNDLEQYMREKGREGFQIIEVALTTNNNWVVLYRRGRSTWAHWSGGDVPQELVSYLEEACDVHNGNLLGVGITPDGGWAASYQTSDRVIYRMQAVPPAAGEYTNDVDRK